MPHTEVILTAPIAGLGVEADVVKVKPGFARNFLIPQGKAYEVSPAALKRINILKAKRAEREAREMNEAEELSRKINKLKLTFTLETGGAGKAFGSVSSHDIHTKLNQELSGGTIDRHQIQLERPIKDSGDHEVPVKLHADVTAKLHVIVKINTPEPAAPDAEVEGKARRPKR